MAERKTKMKLLFVNCCISRWGAGSRTHALAEAFLTAFRAAHPERQCLLVWRSCGDQWRVHLTCKIKGRQFLQYRTNIAAISKIRLTHPANSFIIALLPESAATNSHIKREAFRHGTTTNHFIGIRKRRPPPASALPDGPAPLLSTSAGTSGPPCSAGGDGRRRGR